jgi:bacterioferritin-associated ferredoxin
LAVTNTAPFRHEGPLPGADAVGESGSMSAGPGVRVSLRLGGDVIAAARFETCALDAARAVAEAACAFLEGLTIDDASHVSLLDVACLGAAPATSAVTRTVHYAKSAALLPFLGRRARHGASLTCICFQVPTHEIVVAIAKHRIRTVDELRAHSPATTGCGTCRPDVQRLIDAARDSP